jgi:hypothetical protein
MKCRSDYRLNFRACNRKKREELEVVLVEVKPAHLTARRYDPIAPLIRGSTARTPSLKTWNISLTAPSSLNSHLTGFS